MYNSDMRRIAFITTPELWRHGHGPQHPLKPERLQRTYELLSWYGALDSEHVLAVPPQAPALEDFALFHTHEYVQVVHELSAGRMLDKAHRYGFGPGDNPIFSGMADSEGLKVGGALIGARYLLDGACEVAFNYAGGLHHAGPDTASGFCVFNDAAVAIHWLLQQGLRVAYVDIDVHHGDGVQHAFEDTDQVLTISLHQSGQTLFPGTGFAHETGHGAGKGFTINVPLPPYSDDESYLWAFHQIVPYAIKRFKPDMLVTQLGVDTHFLDPLASLALTTFGHKALFEALLACSPGRWLALGGGGYNLDVVPRSWALAFAVMSGQNLSAELPEPFRKRYGGSTLHDDMKPHLDMPMRKLIHRRVQEVVDQVRQLHDIEGGQPPGVSLDTGR